MKLLLDTHLLIWAAQYPARLPPVARAMMIDPVNSLSFSTASLWEIAIKVSLSRFNLSIDIAVFRDDLLRSGYGELPVSGAHAVAVTSLPPLHKDPFDRLLVAQATVEGLTLVTADATLAGYQGPILLV